MLKNVLPEQLQAELDDKPMSYMVRAYQCENCEAVYSEIVERNDTKRRRKCPGCKKNKLEP